MMADHTCAFSLSVQQQDIAGIMKDHPSYIRQDKIQHLIHLQCAVQDGSCVAQHLRQGTLLALGLFSPLAIANLVLQLLVQLGQGQCTVKNDFFQVIAVFFNSSSFLLRSVMSCPIEMTGPLGSRKSAHSCVWID